MSNVSPSRRGPPSSSIQQVAPLRQDSTASSNSSAYSIYSNPFMLSRTSTLSSTASSGYNSNSFDEKRRIRENSPMASLGEKEELAMNNGVNNNANPAETYGSIRRSLRPLPQVPNASPPAFRHSRSQTIDHSPNQKEHLLRTPTKSKSNLEENMPFSQLDTPSPTQTSPYTRSHHSRNHSTPHAAALSGSELQTLQKSSTSHLRTLSKFAQDPESQQDFPMDKAVPSVTGLHGRRRLKRADSIQGPKTPGKLAGRSGYEWAGRNWMDTQRQFIQAYEYLCHIGEAKEWIEDVINKPIPPIVELEEALRDGVTLAEVVQTLHQGGPLRIFRNPKLQYRHSDNIAIFFRFLEEVELPDLFRFELIDLYEKKNIPKVIHCIHALSWLLFKKGIVDFRIGNLVGQLEFEHHELEKMQKGLDKSGVSMPSFSGMGATFGAEPEPEPEPVETEEERIDRELHEKEEMILDFQAQIRGAILRLNLGNTMNSLWDAESALVDLQSRIRGDWARQIIDYRLSMRRFAVDLQSSARGFLVRTRQRNSEDWWKAQEPGILKLQNLIRARKAREQVQTLRSRMRREESGIKSIQAAIRGALRRKQMDDQYEETRQAGEQAKYLQAAIRGALTRWRVGDQFAETREATEEVKYLQAAIRGMVERARRSSDRLSLDREARKITQLQAAARALLVRKKEAAQMKALSDKSEKWLALQSISRANAVRTSVLSLQSQLRKQTPSATLFQSIFRGASLRNSVQATKDALAGNESTFLNLQSFARGFLYRKGLNADLSALAKEETMITHLQALSGAANLRIHVGGILSELESCEDEIIQLQALSRAMLVRVDVGQTLNDLEAEENYITELQALARGSLVRSRFAEKQRYFKENMEKVIKVQSLVRGKIQGEAYKSLTSGKNPPVGTVKGFVHLLNDSDFDFDEEIEFERLRKTVVQHVRQNEMADQYIAQLDIKIALLVRNKITLDEVVKHQKHFGGHVGSLLPNSDISSKDPFDLKALNKTSRRKLEQYQELFFLLQTQPQYLSRLFSRLAELKTSEEKCEKIKHLIMGLFGYSQKRREEYYLLKLITRSIKEDVDNSTSIQDYVRFNSFWHKLFGAYIKSPKDRKFLRDILGQLVKENVVDNPELDLESDPVRIYQSAINNEELRTGRRSQRNPNIPREEAIKDPETRGTFIRHLQDLRDVADQFFGSLEELLHRMPFGVRFIAQQMYEQLIARFENEDQGYVLQVTGQWIWRNYLQPALTEPEKFGVIDRGLTQEQKRNLGEIAKVLSQVASGRLFGGDNIYLQPLNAYVGDSIQRLGRIWGDIISVPDAESHFDIDEFNDLYAKKKPTLYIKMSDIFSVHQLIAAEILSICPTQDDTLKEVIRDLGSVKSNESELMSVSTSEISLTLNPKLHNVEDPDAEIKALFMETKRCILYIIRVQSGANLMEIMVKPLTDEDEERWNTLVRDELSTSSRKRGAYSDANTLIDIGAMSYSELKRTALENILHLEQAGKITRHNHYQDLLNHIAVDIRTKHRRRIQRQRELEGVRMTLARLNDQATYLEAQFKTYNDYIEQAMVTLQNKKGKKRFLLPFTKQWDHERELHRSGRAFKFGSFKYSARNLADKGVLVHWKGYTERQWDRVDLTISSNEVGVFTIDGSSGNMMVPGANAQVPLDDLLQAQYNNTQFLDFFEGSLRVNVNLFLHLIMRKFYNE
ncbi:hypothetical protein FQN54_004936 [Arachnomyces sp. PD_36]|nr:hypothetical protein FQN54_004936 [Arachnomyces sp. PD_36]